jgi:hypothetical protein
MQRVELEHIGDFVVVKGGSDCRIELALRLAAVRMVVKPSDHCDFVGVWAGCVGFMGLL